MSNEKDPRENLYISGPFNSIGWADWKGWYIQSTGCSCCTHTDEYVSIGNMQEMRDKLVEAVEKIDRVIKVMQAEQEFTDEKRRRIASLVPPEE